MAVENPQYKDRLFNFIFGAEENKAWALSLYNAINGTNYSDPDGIEITTIKEVMYLGMHNDVSLLISEKLLQTYMEMDLFEQQSTFNPNLPLRSLQYIANLYEKFIVQRKLNKYGSKLIMLPVPKLVMFYNGTKDQPDERILKLSDSFPKGTDPDIEVRVRMININAGRSPKIMQACKPLSEYAWLIERIREKEGEIENAIDKAISEMPEDFVIQPFLIAHRAEVRGMLLTEYNEVKTMELFKEEGREEGLKEGRKEGILEILIKMVRRGRISKEEAANEAQMKTSEFEAAMKQAQ